MKILCAMELREALKDLPDSTPIYSCSLSPDQLQAFVRSLREKLDAGEELKTRALVMPIIWAQVSDQGPLVLYCVEGDQE